MALKAINPTKTNAWKKLSQHFLEVKDCQLKQWFIEDPERAERFTVGADDFYFDYSKNRITTETMLLFKELIEQVDLNDAISKYFSGDIINKTEHRSVLHTALRAPQDTDLMLEGVNIIPEVTTVKDKIKSFSNDIISGALRGATGKAFTDIVNIGIGGSDLGPAMIVDALQYYKNHLTMHFVSNVDGDHVNETLKQLNPETTLFVVVSKTFTTQETLSNANTMRSWFLESQLEKSVEKHFVAVSSNIEKVKDFGINEANIFPMWDWVGGRFSLWSAVGLSISLSIGYSNFLSLLDGAHDMDTHFKNEPFETNIPVIMACLGIWYNNFFQFESEVVLPYSQYLNQFATYLQQAIMESNGKNVDRSGDRIDYQTSSIVWGEPGTNSQHAFFQLLHQGTKIIPSDFIAFAKPLHGNKDHQDKLMSNFFAQTEALMNGKSERQVSQELEQQNISETLKSQLRNYKVFEGNRPTSTLLINKLTPHSLGKLVALYEHKIFVQGVIWNIFSYDQFGVELGKELAGKILDDFSSSSTRNHDSSTTKLIDYYKKLR
ncbi:glucose-6-phosphate isomerase [Flavobacteriaceae bacterium]|jgi:glucose-6-phosphate isomerase|nr:glucose-6-phosphate isomerase [Flavobacteriaceae bacterium]